MPDMDMGDMGGAMPMDMPQGSAMAMASKIASLAGDNFEKEMLEEYAERACKTIESSHPNSICDIDEENREIIISENGSPILCLKVSEQ